MKIDSREWDGERNDEKDRHVEQENSRYWHVTFRIFRAYREQRVYGQTRHSHVYDNREEVIDGEDVVHLGDDFR